MLYRCRSHVTFARIAVAAMFTATATSVVQAEGQTLRYEIEGQLDPARAEVRAQATITPPSHAVVERKLRLDLSADDTTMQLREARSISGETLRFQGPDDDGIATVTLDAGSESMSVVVEYTMPLDLGARKSFGYDLVFSIGPGSYWYPDVVNADGDRERFRDFDVTLDYPSSLAVLTTGGEGERTVAGDRTRATYHAEHVEGFAIAAGEGFVVERFEGGDVPVVAFFHPDNAARFETIASLTADAAAWFRVTYGFFPIPFVGVVQGHPRWGGGFPLPRMFMVHLGVLSDDFLSFITAHELGHYYWGLYVLGDEERLDWLVLANGIWADQLYLAERSGRSLDEQWRHPGNGDWIHDYLTSMVADYEQRLGLTEEETQDLHFDYNSLVRHGKGATGVFLQSRLIGAERFLELQREILRDYRYRPLPVDDFVDRLEEVESTRNAREFFQAWRRGDAKLGLVVDQVVPEDPGVRIVLRRAGNVPYPIDVEAETPDGQVTRHTVAADARLDTLRVLDAPVSIRLDPDGVVPMWNAAHPEMRSLLVRAFARAKLDGAFLPQAREHLREVPDDERVRCLLTRRLFQLGRWREAADLWTGGGCESRDQCCIGVYAAWALSRLGHDEEAGADLEELRDGARAVALDALWRRAQAEVEAARTGSQSK